MSLTRTFRTSLALATIGGSALVAMTAVPASAAIVGPCVVHPNGSGTHISVTCTDDNASLWYLRADCERPSGKIVKINGTAVYGPGTGTSNVVCTPPNSELVDWTIVLVNL